MGVLRNIILREFIRKMLIINESLLVIMFGQPSFNDFTTSLILIIISLVNFFLKIMCITKQKSSGTKLVYIVILNTSTNKNIMKFNAD